MKEFGKNFQKALSMYVNFVVDVYRKRTDRISTKKTQIVIPNEGYLVDLG